MVFLLVVGFCVWHDLQSMQSMNKVLSVLKNKQYTINIHTLEVTVRFSESNWQRRSLDLISFFINTKAVESFALCRLKSAIPFAPWNHQSWKRILCVIYVALLAWGQRTDYWFKFNKLLALIFNTSKKQHNECCSPFIPNYQLLNNSTVPHKFYKNDLDFEPYDLFALVTFFFFWDINFSYEKSIPPIYHRLILVCPARVKASSYGHAFKFIQRLPRNTRKDLMTRFSSSILMQKRSSSIMANLQYHHYKRQLPSTGHFISSDDLVFGISFPFWSTHQHLPLVDWHCTSSYRPSSLHRGINRFWESWNGAFRYLRWQEVTAPPEKQANEETDNSVNE